MFYQKKVVSYLFFFTLVSAPIFFCLLLFCLSLFAEAEMKLQMENRSQRNWLFSAFEYTTTTTTTGERERKNEWLLSLLLSFVHTKCLLDIPVAKGSFSISMSVCARDIHQQQVLDEQHILV